MATKEYTIGCLSLYDIASAATHIGMTNLGFPANSEVSDDGSGSLYAEQMCITGFAPVASATSKAISQVLAFIGINGQCVGAGLDVTKVDFIHRRMENCDTSLGATPHIRDRVTKGLLRLGSLSVSGRDDATITTILDTLADGANAPVARTDGVALPTPIASERFAKGIALIAGVQFPKLDGWDLSFNVSIDEKLPGDASIWPETAAVLTVRPVLTIRHRDISLVTDALIAAGASEAAHADTLLQLVRRKNSGSFEDFGDSVHVAITLNGLLLPDDLASAAAQSKTTGTLQLPCSFDGTNAPVLINTAITYDSNP